MTTRLPATCPPIAITGVGAIGSRAHHAGELWNRVRSGQSPAEARPLEGVPEGWIPVCTVDDRQLKVPRSMRELDRAVKLAVHAAGEAWAMAGLHEAHLAPERVGILVGSSRGPVEKWRKSVQDESARRVRPSMAANSTIACLSGTLAQAYGCEGPALTVSAACASASAALAQAAQQIQLGNADVILAGGTEAALHPNVLRQLHAAGVMARHPDPMSACRPFDLHRNGLVAGEGAAFLVLESVEHAFRRGVTPLALLTGWAIGSDTAGRVGLSANGKPLARVIRQCLAGAGLAAGDIDYLNLHGTGTRVNDAFEARAIQEVWGAPECQPLCSSTKPITGHCFGATPALEAVIAVQCLRHDQLPPSVNFKTPDADARLRMAVGNEAIDGGIRRVISTSAGFWGSLGCLVFERADRSGLDSGAG